MKKITLLIILILFRFAVKSQTKQFEKPRYLKFSTLLCPIDITKSYNKEGLLKANNETILIKDSVILVKAKDESNKETNIKKTISDTILVKTIFIEKGYAFDIVQQIGSYSIIKFWGLKESTAKGMYHTLTHKKDTLKYEKLNLKENHEDKLNIDGLVAVLPDEKKIDLSKTYYILPTKSLENNSVEFENKKNL